MKAIILAAGMGSRLLPLNAGRPKAMLEISGCPLIHHLLKGFTAHGIADITIVTGYQQALLTNYVLEAFPNRRFAFIYNPNFREMNNILSFHLCKPYVAGSDLLVCNSDIYCEPDLLEDIVYAPLDTMVVDPQKEYSAEATKVTLNKEGDIDKISKEISPEQSRGEYIGIVKLSELSGRLLFNAVEQAINQRETGLWFIYALNRLLDRITIKPFYTRGRVWEEIDTPADFFCLQQILEQKAKSYTI